MNSSWQTEFWRTVEQWLFDPLTGKLALVLLGLALIVGLMKLLQRTATRYVRNDATRYRARKVANFIGYLSSIVFVALVFSDKFGGFTVAFGVAGAGIAFALQEVIASVAGWMAVSLGGFYKVGDRVQLGGIKGDVIDIGILRTTMMQIGEWVNGDAYNGRTVRVANSFVFKEPVFNYSAELPFLWDEIKIPIKYGSDYRLARNLISGVAKEVAGDYARSAEKAWEPITRRYLIEKAAWNRWYSCLRTRIGSNSPSAMLSTTKHAAPLRTDYSFISSRKLAKFRAKSALRPRRLTLRSSRLLKSGFHVSERRISDGKRRAGLFCA